MGRAGAAGGPGGAAAVGRPGGAARPPRFDPMVRFKCLTCNLKEGLHPQSWTIKHRAECRAEQRERQQRREAQEIERKKNKDKKKKKKGGKQAKPVQQPRKR